MRLLSAAILCLLPFAVPAADRVPEYEVKAALLYKIARFVEWPPESFAPGSDELLICILGNDPFGDRISKLQGRQVDGRSVTILHLPEPSVEQQQCRIAFISEEQPDRLRAWLDALAEIPVLTIGDIDGFGQEGGTVNLLTRNNRVSFEVNVDASSRAGLKISAQLLQLATIVRSDSTRSGG